VVRSQGDELGAAIERTNEGQEWVDEVSDVWNRRLESLYRIDAQLTAGDARFEWIDEEVQTAVASQRDALDSVQGDWWTTDGWNALVGTTATGLDEAIRDSWATYVAERGIADLVDRLAAHPWIVPATELPAGVELAFERTYITPLRELRQWHERIDGAMAALAAADEDTLVAATDDFASAAPLAVALDDDGDVAELGARLDRLTEMVGDRTPDEVARIGLLPDDRQAIDDRLERLVEDRDLDVERTDSGVIVR
jgi:hypothetical protein